MTRDRQEAPPDVLLIGCSAAQQAAVAQALGSGAALHSAAAADEAAQPGRPAPRLVVLAEQARPGETAGLVAQLRATCPQSRPVVLSHRASIAAAVEAVRAGAWDYLACDEQGLARLRDALIATAADAPADADFLPPGVPAVACAQGMIDALRMLHRLAESRCNPILLLGQTGTGKELAASAVHAWRCGGEEPFVAVNCAALTAGLLESELFGHVKGAFTGADRDKTGLFELAGGGTIFLDEISEMPPDLQAKLLRVLQERTFRRVGGTADVACRATVVASSNRDLPAEVRAGRFRKDLYYRLAVLPVTLPPLASPARRADILPLARHFLAASDVVPPSLPRQLSPAAEQALLAHDWPGNVRELRNAVERALILCAGRPIEPADLMLPPAAGQSQVVAGQATPSAAAETPQAPAAATPRPPRREFSLETAEREFIARALRETGWQRTKAAALLGITRATLHAKIKRYRLRPPVEEAAAAAAAPAEDRCVPAGV